MQILLNGIISGLTIALLAIGFSMVYLSCRVFHVALGGIYALVPFIAWATLQLNWHWYFAVPIATLTGVVFSLATEFINHAPLERKGASTGAHLVSSLGIYIVVVQVIALIWGNETRGLRTGLDEVTSIGAIIITRGQILAGVISVAVLFLLYFWLRFSNLGLQFRALADNQKELALRGYNVRRLRLLAFGLSGLLCSASSLLVSYDVGFDPHGGLAALLIAVVAGIIGGRESFLGPVLGGVLLGLVRSETGWFLSTRWQDGVTFLLLGLFLFARPYGILGRKGRLEVQA
jgi:branched-chain amino acid transport system permease protein